ncbi:DsbA family oxidoreductase [Propionibacterium freudenreichii]|uniref:DsbA family oxidoreductase n=1 Tax=Propionibacterium freudenreichii TaxID=1744 RepID=UPI0005A5C8FC|nr:DsbA family oxidoreductase [Propionibacterium freudenreichii]MDK9348779.1 DsbA family oxidoreductase [Propionibacterium freudenreichii]MDK9353002.1 DsbA family oxidoreductase [Propionibacterium freudenreichii]MDK9627721.1 DsbA family oxidoreductase [Propionibacterium freudenreichii]MDK9653006.1 DsbA family oxidoreductase [Propionibacterium freudenreichii]CEI29449.1 Protein-disulfide isomerase (DSBA oxidoreductase) [Propionibacterium freudenreichii]
MTTQLFDHADDRIAVDVWSDVMCPFCYLGDGLLGKALEDFPQADQVDIRYHSFLLMPDLPEGFTRDLSDVLENERGYPREQTEAMNARITEQGAGIGLDYHFDDALATNMRRAHELSHFAKDAGKQHAMVQRLFRAYFTEGLDLGDVDVLADLAGDVGLDRDAAVAALQAGTYADDVETDIAQAQQLGISGVPFFVFNGKYAVSGAQPAEAFSQVLNTVWKESTEAAPAGE